MDAHVYVGLGLSLVSYFGRYAVTELPKSVAWAGVAAGGFVTSVPLWGEDMKPPVGSLLFAVAGFVCFGIAAHLFMNRTQEVALQSGRALPSNPTPSGPAPGTDVVKTTQQYYTRPEIDAMLTSLGELDRFFRPKPVHSEAIQKMIRQVRGVLWAPDIPEYPSIADGLEQYAQQLRNDGIEARRIVKDSDEFVRTVVPDEPTGPNLPFYGILFNVAEVLNDVAGRTTDNRLAAAAIRVQQEQVIDEFTKYRDSIQSTKQKIADKIKDLRGR